MTTNADYQAAQDFLQIWNFSDMKSAQQVPHILLYGNRRVDIQIQPAHGVQKFMFNQPLEFELYSKSFYQYINFNKAMLTATFYIQLKMVEDKSITVTLPFNTISLFDTYTETVGPDLILEESQEYGKFWSLQSLIRDRKIVDVSTWRCTSTVMNIAAKDANEIRRIYPTSRAIKFTCPHGKSGTHTFWFDIQIPIVTQLEAAGWFPIYNIAAPIRLKWTLHDKSKILKAPAEEENASEIEAYWIQDVLLNMESLAVTDNTALNTNKYSWQSISYDVNKMDLKWLYQTPFQTNWSWRSRWNNVKSIMQVVYNATVDNANIEVDHGCDALVAENPWVYYDTVTKKCTSTVWYWNNYRYPGQGAIDQPLIYYKNFCEYYGKYDDNGIEDDKFITFGEYSHYYTGGKFPIMCFDFSTLTQTPSVMSGISSKQSWIDQQTWWQKRDNKAGNVENDLDGYLYTFIVRNVLFVMKGGVLKKIE